MQTTIMDTTATMTMITTLVHVAHMHKADRLVGDNGLYSRSTVTIARRLLTHRQMRHTRSLMADTAFASLRVK